MAIAILSCVVPVLGCSARNIYVALLDYQKLFKVQMWIISKSLKAVKKLKDVGDTCCWKLFILLSRPRHTPRNPVIYLISRRKTEEESVSILVKGQSASLVRWHLQTKGKFPQRFKEHCNAGWLNGTCLFLGLAFTKPVVSHIIFFCKNKQGNG